MPAVDLLSVLDASKDPHILGKRKYTDIDDAAPGAGVGKCALEERRA